MKPERILCAALHFDNGKTYTGQPENIATGFVIAGRIHDDCYATLSVICRVSGGSSMKFDIEGAKRGFLSSAGNFYDRKEAFMIALQAGQVGNLLLQRAGANAELTSDYLY